METLQLVKEIERLPDEAKQKVEALVLELKLHYNRQTPLTEVEIAYWTDPDVFGVSVDDPSRADSTAYVRELREHQWRGK